MMCMASLDSWRTLLAQARADRVNAAGLAEVRARLGIAAPSRRARAHRRSHRPPRPRRRPRARGAARLARSGVSAARGSPRPPERPRSRRWPPTAPLRCWHRPGQFERDIIRRRSISGARPPSACAGRPNARHAEAFRLSLEGWRELEQKDVPAAAAALERAIALNPRDPVARYRYGRVLQAGRDDAGALAQFALTIRDARLAPAPLVGETYLEVARLHERAGRREQAIAAYRSPRTSSAPAKRHTSPPHARWHVS